MNGAIARRHAPMRLPWELVDLCLLWLPDAVQRFRVAVALRREFVRNSTLPQLPSASMDNASRRGLVELLQCWKCSGLEMTFDPFVMDSASDAGHVQVLEWWKQSGLEMKWSNWAMDWASAEGHLPVLQWWRDSGLQLKWSSNTMDYASDTGQTAVLHWWKNSGLEMKWSDGLGEQNGPRRCFGMVENRRVGDEVDRVRSTVGERTGPRRGFTMVEK